MTMRQTSTLIPTMRETPADAEIASHQLLLRAGYIRQTASGVYSYLPLAHRVLRKVEQVIREELERVGAIEVLLPALQPAELWQETGRWDEYGLELFRLQDRHERNFALGPTHEEVITALVRDELNSYKKLPLTLYQIQTKFRDERRPRFGLLRGREFIMKDAYSFHLDDESLDETYEQMKEAYSKICTRLGLRFKIVEADGGSIGGTDTHEFMVLSDVGEDTIAYSDTSDYAANREMAEVSPVTVDCEEQEDILPMERIATPNERTIEEIVTSLEVPIEQTIKTLLFVVDGQLTTVLCRGDYEVNEIKLKRVLQADQVELADDALIYEQLNCHVGSIGPVKLPVGMKVIADWSVRTVRNGVCGANEDGYHYINVNPEHDFAIDRYADIRNIQEGDPSPDGEGTIQFTKGIEIGHIFKLGTQYSEKMKATALDRDGRAQPFQMGCYGLGVSRLLAAIAEQYNDEHGLKWPAKLAPYQIHLVVVNMKNDEQRELGEELYTLLQSYRYDVLYDDREERAGVKFADADLIGLPIRITVGKKASEGIIEVKYRANGEQDEWQKEELTEKLQQYFTKQ